ncbi:MAG: hypothetical protein HOC09_12395 [Deltaproteobacteria bacterium]|nr:hypothetical protein [Deltaproteobacteria bacterium]
MNAKNRPPVDVAATVREYLSSFDGGTFRISDLKRELAFTDKQYTLARQCVKRMADRGEIEKHGGGLGCYRIISEKKEKINWDEVDAKPSRLILPGGLNEIATIRAGDMAAFAGFKNGGKSGLAIQAVKDNLDQFQVHFFITEYKARIKDRLLRFGVDLYHKNLSCYQMEKSDYLPDKIEPGEGVLNVIDHLPNLDNFYLVGKVQDEIHRRLDGALCVITHQKLKKDDNDAIGGSFWRITPTLAISLFTGQPGTFENKMRIVKGKEPAKGKGSIDGLEQGYNLVKGCQFDFSPRGWVRE